MLSVVIPIHNEEPAILPLYDKLTLVMEKIRKPYEIIFIDDASTDRSFDLLANLCETDTRLKIIRLRRNFGQTAALSAGFDEAQGNITTDRPDLEHSRIERRFNAVRQATDGHDPVALKWGT